MPGQQLEMLGTQGVHVSSYGGSSACHGSVPQRSKGRQMNSSANQARAVEAGGAETEET